MKKWFFKKLRGYLVCVFKQQFSVFKQYYIYFHTFLFTRISTHVFKQQFLVFKHIYQTGPKCLVKTVKKYVLKKFSVLLVLIKVTIWGINYQKGQCRYKRIYFILKSTTSYTYYIIIINIYYWYYFNNVWAIFLF